MFKKNDPLVESVKKIMEHNELRRRVEARLCEELGIASRKALPFEHQANYDALFEQRIQEALHPNQQKLDVHEPEKDKLTAQDFKMLRAGKKTSMKEEEQLDERNEENKAKKDAYVRSLGAKSDKPNPYKFKKSVSDLMQGRKELQQMKEEDKSSSDPDMAAPADPRAPKYKDEIKYKEEPKASMPKNPPMPPKRPANLEEKAVSKAQQKFMAMVLAKKRGKMDNASPEVEKAAESMSTKSARDFAKTKHKGLPEKKDSEND